MAYEFVKVERDGPVDGRHPQSAGGDERAAFAGALRAGRGVRRLRRRSGPVGGHRHRRRRAGVLGRQRPEAPGRRRQDGQPAVGVRRPDHALRPDQAADRGGERGGHGRRVRDRAGLRHHHRLGGRGLRPAGAAGGPGGAGRRPAPAAARHRDQAGHGHDPDRAPRLGGGGQGAGLRGRGDGAGRADGGGAALGQGRSASSAPMSIRASKEAVYRGLDEPSLEAAIKGQNRYPAVAALYRSEDFVEGPLAFSQKRAPQWKGR